MKRYEVLLSILIFTIFPDAKIGRVSIGTDILPLLKTTVNVNTSDYYRYDPQLSILRDNYFVSIHTSILIGAHYTLEPIFGLRTNIPSLSYRYGDAFLFGLGNYYTIRKQLGDHLTTLNTGLRYTIMDGFDSYGAPTSGFGFLVGGEFISKYHLAIGIEVKFNILTDFEDLYMYTDFPIFLKWYF